MGVADFLFEGSPPPATTTYGKKTENIPQWLSDYSQGLVARANAVAAEPYQAYGGPRIAGFTADTQNAFNQTRQAANAYQSPLQQAMNFTQQAGQSNPMQQANPYFSGAAGLTMGAVAPGQGGLAQAAPYMQQASQTFPGAAQQYMDPYIQNVLDRSGQMATRQLNEQFLPSLQDKFTRAGQYGSSGMLREGNRGVRDITENLQSQMAGQLSNAYQNAGSMFGADQSRLAGLGQLAGQLGGQQQGALLQAGQQLGGLGSSVGSLAGQTGQLQLGVGQQMGNLAQSAQQLGLAGAGALDTIGQMQQGLNQRNLDTAYQDFQNQTNYPRTTLDWMNSVIRGLPAPTQTTSQQTGPASSYQPSPLAQLGSFGTGVAGLQKLLGGQG